MADKNLTDYYFPTADRRRAGAHILAMGRRAYRRAAKHNWPEGRKPPPHSGELAEIRAAVQAAVERTNLAPPKGWRFGPQRVSHSLP